MKSGDVSSQQHFDAGGSAGFGSVSPLEPLDPTKFRNIMVEKPESSAFGSKESTGSFCDTLSGTNDLVQSELESMGHQQSSDGAFMHSCFTPASTPVFHQSTPQHLRSLQPSLSTPQQQQPYLIQQSPQANYGPIHSSLAAVSHFGVRNQQPNYLVPEGVSSIQSNWIQQHHQGQYLSPQLSQNNRMGSPKQQQFVTKQSQLFQVPSYPGDIAQQQTIVYPPSQMLLHNSPPVATKQEFSHQYHQQILVQQQQPPQRFTAAYAPQPLLAHPNQSALPSGSNNGIVEHRSYMDQPCSLPTGSQNNPQVLRQPNVHQLNKAQPMLFHASSEMANQHQLGSANLSVNTFPSPSPSASFILPPSSKDFAMVNQRNSKQQQPIVRLPSSQQLQHAHLLHQIPSQIPQFFGHDPHLAATLNPDICLAGCVFLLIDDCDPNLVDFPLLPSIIRFYGGDVESNNPRGIPERVTHVVCSNWIENETLIQQALSATFLDRMPRKMKRVVSLNWLNDAIAKRQVTAPSKACHLPSIWSSLRSNPKTFSKVIAVYGFTKREMLELKYMIKMIGARFSANIEQKSDFLVVPKRIVTDNLCQFAASLGTALVNFQWLVELYFGSLNCLTSPDQHRFLPQSENDLLTATYCSPLALSKVCEMCHKLLAPWSQSPILLNEEITRLAHEMKYNVKHDITIFPENQFKISATAPTESQIEAANVIYVNSGHKTEGFYPEQIENLSKKARFLGAEIVSSVTTCTHFVTASLHRTANLLEAIALGKSVVTPLWVEASFRQLGFVQDLNFFVRDRENEKKYGFNLKATILRARNRRIFKDVEFHLSSGVQPKYEIIRRLVQAAGGSVQEEKPKKNQLLHCIQNDKTFFIICDANSLNSYLFLMECNFAIFNENFILMAILRHKIDISDEFRAYITNPSHALNI